MPDAKISQLPAVTSLSGSEPIPVVQSGATKRATPAQIKTYIADAAPTGDGQNDGLLTHEDKAKLDGIEAGATGDLTAQEIANAIDADATAETTLKSALGLGSAAYANTSDFATAAQGSAADTALQPGDVDDTPVDGATTAPISSNWAFDQNVLLATETDNRVLYDQQLAGGVAYATDLAGQAARTLSGSLPNNVPASASAPGVAGQMRYASGFLYVCVAANTWQRVAIATWA